MQIGVRGFIEYKSLGRRSIDHSIATMFVNPLVQEQVHSLGKRISGRR